MSAFVVSKQHIDALVSVAELGPRDPESRWDTFTWPRTVEPYAPSPDYPEYTTTIKWQRLGIESSADELGFILWAENVASVSYRYPEDTPEELPGTMVQTDRGMVAECTQGYTFERIAKRPTVVEALKLIACLDYQSCEHPGWKESEAFAVLENLKDRLIMSLPGYSAAAWEYTA